MEEGPVSGATLTYSLPLRLRELRRSRRRKSHSLTSQLKSRYSEESQPLSSPMFNFRLFLLVISDILTLITNINHTLFYKISQWSDQR